MYTVEPPNSGHMYIGVNKYSVVLSFVERLSSFRGSQYIESLRRSFTEAHSATSQIMHTQNSHNDIIIHMPMSCMQPIRLKY